MIHVRITDMKSLKSIKCGVHVLPEKGDIVSAKIDLSLSQYKVQGRVFEFDSEGQFQIINIDVLKVL